MPEHQQTQQSTGSKQTSQKQANSIFQTPVSNPTSIIQHARINPKSLTPSDVLQLQRTIGNRAVGKLLSGIRSPSTAQQIPIQRQKIPEEEEPLQGMFENKPEKENCSSCMQMQEILEEGEPLQGKMIETVQRLKIPEEEEKLQMKSIVQRQEILDEDEPIQGKMIETIQLQEIPDEEEPLQRKRENNTGMPDNLKAGVESLSGIDMSDVRVHYNSDEPSEVGALAYTQGTNIHVAPGQERHLPHEAWHVVQQAQGRVKPTMQMKGLAVNDDVGLEREADVMGAKALQMPLIDLSATVANLQAAMTTQMTGETSEASYVQGVTIEASGKNERLNFLSAVCSPDIVDETPVIQGVFTCDGIPQRNLSKEIADLFGHYIGFDKVISDYNTIQSAREPQNFGVWFILQLNLLGLQVTSDEIAVFITKYKSHQFDELSQQAQRISVSFQGASSQSEQKGNSGPRLQSALSATQSLDIGKLLNSRLGFSPLERDMPIAQSDIESKYVDQMISILQKKAKEDLKCMSDDPKYTRIKGYQDSLQSAIEVVKKVYGNVIDKAARTTGDTSVKDSLESVSIAHSKMRLQTASPEYRRQQGFQALNWYMSNNEEIIRVIQELKRRLHTQSSEGTIMQAYEEAIRAKLQSCDLDLLANVRLSWGPITVGNTIYMEMARGTLAQHRKSKWLDITLVHEVIHAAEHPAFSEFLAIYIPDHLQSDIREGITEYLAMYALDQVEESSEDYPNQKLMIDSIIGKLPDGYQRLVEAYWFGNVEAFLPVMQLADFRKNKSQDEMDFDEMMIVENHGIFRLGVANGNGLNCLIDSIGQALDIETTNLFRRNVRLKLIEIGLATENDFLWNDQNVLSAIIQCLGLDPQTLTIIFVDDMGRIDDQTYNFDGRKIYIRNRRNVHFDPMFFYSKGAQ
jgi:hypothetical protein